MKRLAAVLAALLAPTAALAGPLVVAQDGSGGFETLGAALDAAGVDAHILIRTGTYEETLVLTDRRLTIEADAGARVVIRGTDPAPVLTVTGSPTSALTLRGLVVEGPTGPLEEPEWDGGCLRVVGGTVLLEGLLLRSCVARNGGGVALVDVDEDSAVRDVEVTGCEARVLDPDSGEIEGVGGGVLLEDAAAQLDRLWLHHNQAGSGGGIGVLQDRGSELTRSWIEENVADMGGGVAVYGPSSPASPRPTIGATLLHENVARLLGGGLLVDGDGWTELRGVSLLANRTEATSGGAGGGIWVDSARADLHACTLGRNNSADFGGGVAAWYESAVLTVDRSVVRANQARSSAALAISTSGRVELRRSLLQGNLADDDLGGALLEAPEATLEALVLDDNDAGTGTAGGSLRLLGGSGPGGVTLRNLFILDSDAGRSPALYLGASQASVTHTTIHGASAGTADTGAVEFGSDAAGGVFRSNLVAATGGAWDVFDSPSDGLAAVARSHNLLTGSGQGPYGGLDPGPSDLLELDPGFTGTELDEGLTSLLRVSGESPGADGASPDDGEPLEVGAWGGSGAVMWSEGDQDEDGVSVWDGDCNDDDPAVRPGAEERCNCRDDDCDLFVDEGVVCGPCLPEPGEAPADDDDSAGEPPPGDDDDDDDDSGSSSAAPPAPGCLLRCDAVSPVTHGWIGLLLLPWALAARRRS